MNLLYAGLLIGAFVGLTVGIMLPTAPIRPPEPPDFAAVRHYLDRVKASVERAEQELRLLEGITPKDEDE